MTIEKARVKLSDWIGKNKKPEMDPNKNILGYFIAPTDRENYYDYLRRFWNLDTPSMIELFKSNGEFQKSIEHEDVDVFYFRGLYWKKMREWREENDEKSYTIYDIPQEFCANEELGQ